jgi:hypothetical protein
VFDGQECPAYEVVLDQSLGPAKPQPKLLKEMTNSTKAMETF